MELMRDRFGQWIRLSDERLDHLQREHPELRGIELLLAAVLGDPDSIVQSLSDPLVWLYYRSIHHFALGDKLLCVAVKSHLTGNFVLTAYLTNRRKRGPRIWPLDA